MFFDDSLGLDDRGVAITVDSVGSVYVTGTRTGVLVGNLDYVTLKYSQPTGIIDSETGEGIGEFVLNQNYPNPFNPSTRLNFELAHSQWVTLTLYDVVGREVKVLVNGRLPAGFHTVSGKFEIRPVF